MGIVKVNFNIFSALIFGVLLSLFATPVLAESGDDGEHYDPVATVLDHISDKNEFHIWENVHIPLPCFLYAPDNGWSFFMSSKFDHGHKAVDGYILNHGRVNRIADPSFPKGEVDLHESPIESHNITVDGKEKEVYSITYHDKEYQLDPPSTVDGGFVGGGLTSFYDFSITKNVATMLLAAFLLVWLFMAVAKGYRKNEGKAPKGVQNLIEPFFIFIRDEVTRPMIGEKHYERFQPFIMSLFFFILFCDLMGLIPFFPGGANITGNLAVTMTLAVITFFVVNLSGKKDYWEHIFWMPGIPAWVKIILTPVEILSLFIKPFSLMIRLFANISAGHIIILSLIGLIFLFKDTGQLGGATTGIIIGGAFTAFMNLIELLVAFLQAYIFAMLTASYIGAAVEEHHHEEAH
jgi:F-type H+-transporting ATPase subunit a